MAGYIGKVEINGSNPVLVGSTLYGVCSTSAGTAAKVLGAADDPAGKLINTNYDHFLQGTTIHVKFTNGNEVTSGMTLAVGSTSAAAVVGNCTCPANTIISFTLDENQQWVVNDNVDTDTTYTFSEGTTNGAFNVSVNGGNATPITIHGLDDAAYKAVSTTFTNTASIDLPTVAAVAQYVSAQTGGLAGLTGAMHFRGVATSEPTGSTTPSGIPDYESANPESGDVVLYEDKEFVWTGTAWELLGDEGSYALKSSTGTAINAASFTANTLPVLTTATVNASSVTVTPGSAAALETTAVNIPNVTRAGTPTVAEVTAGILVITSGTATELGSAISVTAVSSFTANSPTVVSTTDVTINSVSSWDAGSAAQFTSSTTTVVIP